MVAAKVTVISRALGSGEAWQWESKGVEGYTLTPADKAGPRHRGHHGASRRTPTTRSTASIWTSTPWPASSRKYSDYVRYPITMYRQKSRQKPKPEDAGDDYKPEYETYTELETLNSMVPIWKRDKKDVKEEDYSEFYKNRFTDFTDPLRVITSRTEGTATYTALLCSCPAAPPTTTTPRSTRRAWRCTPPACSSWKSAPTCCPTTSALSRAWWTART